MSKRSKDYTGIYDLEDNGLDANLFKQGISASNQGISSANLGASATKKDTSSKVVKKKGKTLASAIEIITQQMRTSGYRERTIADYTRYFSQYSKATGITYLEDITIDSIYQWLDSMEVSNQTKLIRLKSFKAVLGRCLSNGWFKNCFWRDIRIKVDKKVKKGAKQEDVMVLLSLLDLNTFIGLRDAVAVLTLYKTGVRINTLGKLEEKHVDFKNKFLCMDGAVMKNHNALKLPLDEQLLHLLAVLIKQNNKVREYYGEENKFLFISCRGVAMNSKSSNNAISKQLNKYAKKYGLENINPHSLRRAYAKSLLDKGANLALISKALGHSDLSVTTQYLDLEMDEVANNLRDFM